MTAPYKLAQERYAALGVDTEKALQTLQNQSVSLHCWQGDDVVGFEPVAASGGGGILATGNYPGRARTIDELRADLKFAMNLIPGAKRLNLHAIYGDFGGKRIARDLLDYSHFASWVDWCAERQIGMDFNPTCFNHPLADDGFTLSHAHKAVRNFWIEHCKACRNIAAKAGAALGSPSVVNIWIPDGMKDLTVDRMAYRERLLASLDTILEQKHSPTHLLDAVESKLFGIGVESYTVGSHDFYLSYAATRQCLLTLDAGHFHPTEFLADKISGSLLFVPGFLLHVSRGVRWDSDHVVILDDPTQAIFQELVRCKALTKTHIGLDFFDASINRIAAWVIGTRSTQRALLIALLEPTAALRKAEEERDYTARLALLEAMKTFPWGAVWDEYCRRNEVPCETDWLGAVKQYEKEVLDWRC